MVGNITKKLYTGIMKISVSSTGINPTGMSGKQTVDDTGAEAGAKAKTEGKTETNTGTTEIKVLVLEPSKFGGSAGPCNMLFHEVPIFHFHKKLYKNHPTFQKSLK